jgi:hypothetical protein
MFHLPVLDRKPLKEFHFNFLVTFVMKQILITSVVLFTFGTYWYLIFQMKLFTYKISNAFFLP